MEIVFAFIALTIVGIAAQFVGDDSRDGFDPAPPPDGWNLPRQHG